MARPIYQGWLAYQKDTLPYYKREMAQRFGKAYPAAPKGEVIWCHAVSLGELNSAYSLLKILLDLGFTLFITSTTQTGYQRVKDLFGNEIAGGTVAHSFVPVDDKAVIERFLEDVRPMMALFIETELWANTLYILKKRRIPSVLVNARLNKTSYQRYGKFAKTTQSILQNLDLIIAQDDKSATRFIKLGASDDKVKQALSLKWAAVPIDFVAPKGLDRPVWVAASTHDTEEAACLSAHQTLLKTYPNALLILVPRHPDRFDTVYQLCLDSGLVVTRRSKTEFEQLSKTVQVYLADSMGELLSWYAISDVAFVGGSLIDKGGHNPIEPAYFAKQMIMGGYTKNCDVLVNEFIKAGAMVKVMDSDGLAQALTDWLDDTQRGEKGKRGKQLVDQNKTADEQQAKIILDFWQHTRYEHTACR